ncbi:hypothetical protein trd_0939 [Thermomicrobium roseum DSM 5159]|uniref:Uncharacterized protein n=1 Tax=Thermomicrobium roseum (strain ATCC 27502 / DSM 5159 / P-2) TaxID=309801 RepID=B9KZU3_THERP|nr:hypothetical protein trd_0939 [Thermomicrobium roseum DSM 5159]
MGSRDRFLFSLRSPGIDRFCTSVALEPIAAHGYLVVFSTGVTPACAGGPG